MSVLRERIALITDLLWRSGHSMRKMRFVRPQMIAAYRWTIIFVLPFCVVGAESPRVEVGKLGHGGLEYIAKLFGCDPKTIRRGMAELESEEELASERQRKKGGEGYR